MSFPTSVFPHFHPKPNTPFDEASSWWSRQEVVLPCSKDLKAKIQEKLGKSKQDEEPHQPKKLSAVLPSHRRKRVGKSAFIIRHQRMIIQAKEKTSVKRQQQSFED